MGTAAIEITELAPRTYSPTQRGVPSVEAPLHQAAMAAAKRLATPGSGHLVVIPELEVFGMRPDLWIGSFDEGQFRRRAEAGIEPCTAPYPLAIAQELQRLGGQASIDRLSAPSRGLGQRRRVLRGAAELVERGLAVREDDVLQLNQAWQPANANGVGVEAKVGRWRKAVRQAQMWMPFLNGAWLVFPCSYLPYVPRQGAGLRGMGIASVDDDVVQVIRRPRLRVGRTHSRMVLEEHLYSRWRTEAIEAGGCRKRAPAGGAKRRARAIAPA